jgi:hypothetical protein
MLPRRWRDSVFPVEDRAVARAAIISGVLEAVLGLIALLIWYSMFVTMASQAVAHSSNPEAGSPLIGPFAYIWFWINPITWSVAYFGVEGAVRAVAALTNGDVYGTLPLLLFDRLFRRSQAAPPEAPVIADELLPGNKTSDMRIASCRSKAHWQYPFTIRYQGTFFQVVSCLQLRGGLRPYIYSLRRLPHGEIASGLRDYDPQDILAGK